MWSVEDSEKPLIAATTASEASAKSTKARLWGLKKMLRGPNLSSGESKERFGGWLGSGYEVVIARGQVFSQFFMFLFFELERRGLPILIWMCIWRVVISKRPTLFHTAFVFVFVFKSVLLFEFVFVLEGWWLQRGQLFSPLRSNPHPSLWAFVQASVVARRRGYINCI